MAFLSLESEDLQKDFVHKLVVSEVAVEDNNYIGSCYSDTSLKSEWEKAHIICKNGTRSKELVSYGVPEGKALEEDDHSKLDKSRPIRSIEDLPSALISEILHCLDAKELGIVSCVSTTLNNLASDHQGWKNFYCNRWGPRPAAMQSHPALPDDKSWKELFVEREFRANEFMGRYSMDVLHGHTEAVRSVFLLKSAKLIFTGGYDSILRMWSMEDNLCIASSRPLGCTIRAITADIELLVAGGTDGFLQCWRKIEGYPNHFDILGIASNRSSERRLWGHEGPVTCIALDSTRIFSGSWDTSIRVWDKKQLTCINVLWHCDWVWALEPCGPTLASTAGRDVYIWDIQNGRLVNAIHKVHSDNALSLARSYAGDLLFVGGKDGVIHMFELNQLEPYNDDIKAIATWIPHSNPVNSLAFEFPWLVSSSSDGRLALIDVRKLLKSSWCFPSKKYNVPKQSTNKCTIEAPQRMLHGHGCNLYSVDIGADRIVCGGEDGVMVWDFSQALEIEKRVQASRRVRFENRMRRRKVQNEMNTKGGMGDQCSFAAKRNQVNGDRTGVWHSKRNISGRLKS